MEVKSSAVIISEVVPYGQNADNIADQITRVEITDNETYTRAADLMKVNNSQMKAADDARKVLVQPLNAHVKFINDQFRPKTAKFTENKSNLQAKLDVWARAESARIAEEERIAREKVEAEALKAATIAEDAGDSETAEAIVEQAAAPEKKRSGVVGRSSMGTTASIKKVWGFEVEDVKALCTAIGRGEVPVDAVTPNSVWIRQYMNIHKENASIPGVKFEHVAKASVR